MKKSHDTKSSGNKRMPNKAEVKSNVPQNSATKRDLLDDEEQGFGGWLRSSDGLETMKLFVIANSVVMLTTVAYPHVQAVFEIVSNMIYGPDALF